jgi:hypothetical protein
MYSCDRLTRLCSSGTPSPGRSLCSKVLEGTLRASILAGAMCIGVRLGIRPQAFNGRFSSASRANHYIQTRRSVCGGNEVAADSDVPPGYIPAGLTRIDGDCFAMFEANDAAASPAPEPGSGVADVFGPDGRLTLRFSTIQQPNGQWKMVEYRRLPVGDAPGLGSQR